VSTNPGRLPGIEGLRGIAACSILAYHAWLFSSPAKPGWNLGPITAFVPPLQSGVTLFFVLSGFLLYRPISDALLHGRPLPSISRYLRSRALRILPAYWTVLLITGLAGTTILGASHSGLRVGPPGDARLLLEDALLVANYRPSTMWTGVLPAWSVTIEIAFYLALPALAVMAAALARRGERDSPTRAALAPIAVLLVVGFGGKVAAALFVPGPGRSAASDWHAVLERSLLTHADLFAFGMLAALLLSLHRDGALRIPPALLGGLGGRLLLYVGAPFGVLGYYTLSPYV